MLLLPLAAALAIAQATSAAPTAEPEPVVRVVDATSLADRVTFPMLPPERLARWGPSKVRDRIDVLVPAGLTVERIDFDTDNSIIALSDGRCHAIHVSRMADRFVTSVREERCPKPRPRVAPHARPGWRYVGRAFNRDAWTNLRTGVTELTYAADTPRSVTIRMPVLAIGGSGSPDTPTTGIWVATPLDGHLAIVFLAMVEP